MKIKPILIFLPLFLFLNILIGQPTEKFIKVLVAPDHSDWMYKKGEPVKFTISVLKNGKAVGKKGTANVTYTGVEFRLAWPSTFK